MLDQWLEPLRPRRIIQSSFFKKHFQQSHTTAHRQLNLAAALDQYSLLLATLPGMAQLVSGLQSWILRTGDSFRLDCHRTATGQENLGKDRIKKSASEESVGEVAASLGLCPNPEVYRIEPKASCGRKQNRQDATEDYPQSCDELQVDEIQWHRGHQDQTVVDQHTLDGGSTRWARATARGGSRRARSGQLRPSSNQAHERRLRRNKTQEAKNSMEPVEGSGTIAQVK